MKIFLLSLCLLFSQIGLGNSFYPLDSQKQEAQFSQLLKNLRCLVCQNQDLSDSNAGLARDLRFQVYTMVRNNHSDDEIIHYLTKRYGDFILFKPPVKAITFLLWVGPFLFLLLGFMIFWRQCLKRRIFLPKNS